MCQIQGAATTAYFLVRLGASNEADGALHSSLRWNEKNQYAYVLRRRKMCQMQGAATTAYFLVRLGVSADADGALYCVPTIELRTCYSISAKYSKAKAYPLNPSPQICPTQAGAVTDLWRNSSRWWILLICTSIVGIFTAFKASRIAML